MDKNQEGTGMAKVTLKGWDRYSRRIEAVARGLQTDIVPVIQAEGGKIKNAMKRMAPVDTGFMRDHITKRDIKIGVIIESEAPYSLWVDRGTSRMFGIPFFRFPLLVGIRRIMRKLRITIAQAR